MIAFGGCCYNEDDGFWISLDSRVNYDLLFFIWYSPTYVKFLIVAGLGYLGKTQPWKKLVMIKGILFDKDGTLLEFHSTMHHIYTNVFAYLKDRYSVPELLLLQLKNALGHLPDRLRSDSLLPLSTNPQIAEALLEPSEKYAAEHQWQQPFGKSDLLALIEELSLSENVPYTALSGVPETLKYLKINDYKLGIATADTRTATVAGLKKAEICNYFDYLGTGDESKPKPDTYLADMFCIECGIAPNEMLIVGDSKNDMLYKGTCLSGSPMDKNVTKAAYI